MASAVHISINDAKKYLSSIEITGKIPQLVWHEFYTYLISKYAYTYIITIHGLIKIASGSHQ